MLELMDHYHDLNHRGSMFKENNLAMSCSGKKRLGRLPVVSYYLHRAGPKTLVIVFQTRQ